MPSLADNLLTVGVSITEAVHGERVVVLTGLDAGKTFTGVRENSADVVLDENLSPDARAKRIIRFRPGSVPRLNPTDRLRTDDGKVWKAVKYPQDNFLTEDFELIEITTKDT